MDDRADFAKSTRAARARGGFYIHLTAYLAVNALLVFINLNTTPGRLWCRWPLMGWGIGLFAHALAVFVLPHLRSRRTSGR